MDAELTLGETVEDHERTGQPLTVDAADEFAPWVPAGADASLAVIWLPA